MPRDKSSRYREASKRRSSSYSSHSSYERKKSKSKHKRRSRSRDKSESSYKRNRSSSRSKPKSKRSYSRSASRDRYVSKSKRSTSRTRSKKTSRRSTSKERSRGRSRSLSSIRSKSKRYKHRTRHRSVSSESSSQSSSEPERPGRKFNLDDTESKVEKAIKAAEAAGLTMTKLPTYEYKEVEVKENMPSIHDRNLLAELNNESFVQKPFTSSRGKKFSENIVIDLDTQTMKVPEVEVPEDDCILDLDEIPCEEELKEMWIKKLFLFRRKMLKEET